MENERGVVLTKDQLRTLAKLIQSQEEQRIKSIAFLSERDRCDYLRSSRGNHDKVVAFLDDKAADTLLVSAAEADADADPVGEVVQNYLAYLEMAVGFGMQTVKNVHLRQDFLDKLRGHADTLIPKINKLKDGSLEEWQIEEEAQQLIEELAVFKDAMYKSIIKRADPSSQNFSRALKLSGNSFEELVFKYQKKLIEAKGADYEGPFEYLRDEIKIEVYDTIIESSGRGTFLSNTLYKAAGKVGHGLLIFTLAMSVWDIYSSEHKLQTIVTEAAEFGGGWAGGYVGEIAGAAITGYLVAAVGIEATVVTAAFVGLAAFVTGFGIGIALGILAGYVVTKIFESGGRHTGGAISVKKGEHKKLPGSVHHFQVYAAPMPDGALLARQIAYKGASARVAACA